MSLKSIKKPGRPGKTEEIRVLSVKQPFADFIIYDKKWCENRPRTQSYRGRLFIHSSLKWHDGVDNDYTPGNGQMGAIIGCVDLVDCVKIEEVGLEETKRIARSHGLSTSLECMAHVQGEVGLILKNPRALKKPIPASGALGIWRYQVKSDRLEFHRNPRTGVTNPTDEPRPEWLTNPSRSDGKDAVPIDQLDRNDIIATIRDVFSNGDAMGRYEAIKEVAKALGYNRVGDRIKKTVSNAIRTAVRRKILENDAGELFLLCNEIETFTRDELISVLLSAMGQTWWDQTDATREAARSLGYRRTGKNIQKAFKSTINAAIRRGLLERDGAELRRV